MNDSQRRGRAMVVTAAATACAMAAVVAGCGNDPTPPAAGKSPSRSTIGIVEQQLTNPFFGTIQRAAKARAEKNGYDVMTAEAKTAGDAASQVAAIENMIARGVKGIVVDPANATALNGVIKQARDKGILVVTTNTQTDPQNAVDASYETDNLLAGNFVGQWARTQLKGAAPHVAMLDYDLSDRTAKARHDGFLEGFGLKPGASGIAGSAVTKANVDTGRSAMENLLSAHSNVNAVYAINEPAAEGAAAAIKAAGASARIALTGIDGSCDGVRAVKDGTIGATVMQFPSKMGELAVDAIVKYAKDGTKPSGGVTDPGTVLITDRPASGIESQTSAWGLDNCWGD
jgi:fructose transport system substrate-binding protein